MGIGAEADLIGVLVQPVSDARRVRLRILSGGLLMALTVLAPHSAAQSSPHFRTLYSFAGAPNDGANPQARMSLKDGVLYGTTYSGGLGNWGSVFSLSPSASPKNPWTEQELYSFNGGADGALPGGLPLEGPQGVVAGTTTLGGAAGLGAVFAVTPPAEPGGSWTERVLYSFLGSANGDGEQPAGPLIESGGVLYGTTSFGGTQAGGTVFSLMAPGSPDSPWAERVLYSFPSGDGGFFPSTLLVDNSGVLYGTTKFGGAGTCGSDGSGCGTVFSLTPPAAPGGSWTPQVLYSFRGGNDGEQPHTLTMDGNGVLYGTTLYGGGGPCSQSSSGCGMVFSLTPPAAADGSWTEQVLYSFTNIDGAQPDALMLTGTRLLLGTGQLGGLYGFGVIFALYPPSTRDGDWSEQVLYNFTGGADGGEPVAFAITRSGAIYGATALYGTPGYGTVFQFTP